MLGMRRGRRKSGPRGMSFELGCMRWAGLGQSSTDVYLSKIPREN